jgi:vacuolar protein sorting-associated protein 13A/C
MFGIFAGGVGLIKNVVAGTFNSLESISESMSSGLSSLSMDEKYI